MFYRPRPGSEAVQEWLKGLREAKRYTNEMVAQQLAEAMRKQTTYKNKMAAQLKMSRSQIDRLLDPKNSITC